MNIFQAVIRPFQTQTSQSGVTSQQSAGSSDREEDGFLVVAETESERTTVYASGFTGNTPPDYNQVGNTNYHPPTYMDYMKETVSKTSQQEPTLSYNTIPLSSHTEISGVSFEVAPDLKVIFDMHQSASENYSFLQSTDIDACRFTYDFSLEEKVLRDAQCIEMR